MDCQNGGESDEEVKKLEEARGDVGYAGDIKVPLAPYRLSEEARRRGEGDKILR